MSEENYEKSPMAQRLERRMLEVGFETKGKLSSTSGVSRAILTNIMRRPDKEIWASVAIRLAKHLKCRVEWLLDGTGPVSEDIEQNYAMIYGHCPKLTLTELAVEEVEALVAEAFNSQTAELLHCPVISSKNTVAIKAERQLGSIDAEDYIFVDLEKRTPRNGQIVLARRKGTTSAPEFYRYTSALDKAFLRALTDDLPSELQVTPVTEDIEIVGGAIASTKIL